MSVDLTQVLEDVASKLWRDAQGAEELLPDWEDLDAYNKQQVKQGLLPTVSQTAQAVEAAVREQVATQLEAEASGAPHPDLAAWQPGLHQAARIVRTGEGYRA